ncbi:YbfB/YjiJ family MFS transporter [Pollutimonas sp. M17]|uniref:YbfB/YjiJ family MFS transporter n=1 Tax=Pollutimonas sp. M17 TaxID=2962065 RepID=UPI0021F400A5|nr:YbfB/YjiJ family MFS transporter [Pollutimonas sp. M17]UYO95245.1 YbfB/YjiJ family MFS transporter [Pollutimonas sp. M17]
MQHKPSAILLSISGFIALAVAMGIGRFAFTPLLPMMQSDAGLDLAQGGWLASANYLGYLAGALTAAIVPGSPAALLRLGLALVVATTALMGITDGWAAWLAWRFIAGLASAWVLISTATLCLARLAALGQSRRAGLVFAGVGTGIAMAGLLCLGLDLSGASSAQAWLVLGSVALAGTVAARPLWAVPFSVPASHESPQENQGLGRHWRLIACYGLFGFGYILPATFLPAQARLLVQDPAVFGLAWPLFGLAAAVSTLLASRLAARYGRRKVWAAAQFAMAAGVLLPVLASSVTAIVLAAIFVGGTFMIVTMLGMQEGQAAGGRHARKLIAALTASFAAGQLAGPIFFSMTHVWFDAGLDFALILAAVGLLLGTALLRTPVPAASASKDPAAPPC